MYASFNEDKLSKYICIYIYVHDIILADLT